MNILLDTHTFIWWDDDISKMSKTALEICQNKDPFDRLLIAQALKEEMTNSPPILFRYYGDSLTTLLRTRQLQRVAHTTNRQSHATIRESYHIQRIQRRFQLL